MKSALRTLFLAWLFLFTSSALAFQYSRPIESLPSAQEEFVGVELDSQAYAHSASDFRDLRLLDQKNVETPFLLQKLQITETETLREFHDLQLHSLHQSEDHAIEIELRLEADAPPADGLVLHTPLINFEHRVQVFGSVDGRVWNPLVEDAMIFDYSEFVDLRQLEIRLPANHDRRLKLRLEIPVVNYASNEREVVREIQRERELSRHESTTIRRIPLRIDRIEYWSGQEAKRSVKENLRDYPVKSFRIEEDLSSKNTGIEITMQREPITSFVIQSDQRNFNRLAVVEIPAPRQPAGWRSIAENTLQRIRFRALRHEQMQLEFPEQRGPRYRVVVHNHSNPPLTISGVKARGVVHQILFLAEPDQRYILVYGDDSAQAPSYDTATIKAALDAYNPIPAALGEESSNPERAASKWNLSHWLNSDLFLGGVVFLVVAVLAMTLWRAAKRIDSNLK